MSEMRGTEWESLESLEGVGFGSNKQDLVMVSGPFYPPWLVMVWDKDEGIYGSLR